ncbi:Tetracycline resistance protein, class C [Defluviimonas aquaemixtae]|uniref:Tetracycline resistance protein, class C n=1 Tax=Albidovulum aquaemixtae TaxID=1542388 RepID=A0A2R8BNH6_9RHOB|nr:MFS transporter [Defluviimonas aquaemixtae]SPH24991.1 Tetracycline resistance protein, class C [Defluviimonas aquaemixtae]
MSDGSPAPREGPVTAARRDSTLTPLLAITFVGTLGFSIVTPFLVVLVTKWGGNAVIYAVLAATYSVFQLFGAPILGRLSDRVGRRKVLILSQLGTLVSWGMFLAAFALPAHEIARISHGYLGEFALTLPLLVLFLARATDGLTGGNVSVANAYLADVTTDKDRSRNFGRMAVSTNLGFIVGPALAGILGATVLGEVLPVLSAFAISALALVLIMFGLRDVAVAPIDAKLAAPSACDLYGNELKPGYQVDCERPGGVRAILDLPHMRALMSINFLVMLGFSFFYAAFPVHAVAALSWTVVDIGTYFAVLSLMMVVVQGPILSWAAARFSERVLMTGGGVIMALGFGALTATERPVIYLGAALIALGNGLMWPTFMSALSRSAGKRLQGAVQGFAGSAGAIASVAGLLAGGVAYVRIGAWVFACAAVVIVFASVVAVFAARATSGKVSDQSN